MKEFKRSISKSFGFAKHTSEKISSEYGSFSRSFTTSDGIKSKRETKFTSSSRRTEKNAMFETDEKEKTTLRHRVKEERSSSRKRYPIQSTKSFVFGIIDSKNLKNHYHK